MSHFQIEELSKFQRISENGPGPRGQSSGDVTLGGVRMKEALAQS